MCLKIKFLLGGRVHVHIGRGATVKEYDYLCVLHVHVHKDHINTKFSHKCIFTQSASQKMHFLICDASLVCKYRNLFSQIQFCGTLSKILVTPKQQDHGVPGLNLKQKYIIVQFLVHTYLYGVVGGSIQCSFGLVFGEYISVKVSLCCVPHSCAFLLNLSL